MKSLIQAGKIINTHGIRGEVRIEPWADSPEFLTNFKVIYIDEKPVNVLSMRVHKNIIIAGLENSSSIDDAIKLKNKTVCIDREDTRLEEGRFFVADIIGLKTIDAGKGDVIGIVSEVLFLPANDVYVIKGEREILVPAVPDFIDEVNIAGGYIKVRLIEGM